MTKKRRYKWKHKRTGTNFKTVKIVKRDFAWYKRKHKIWLDPLLPSYQKLLVENRFMKLFTEDEHLLRSIFLITDMEQQNKHFNKYRYDVSTDKVLKTKEFKESYNKLDWKCALCESDIKSDIDKITLENFCCDKCIENINHRNPDVLILKSSIEFTKYAKKVLKAEQRKVKIHLKLI